MNETNIPTKCESAVPQTREETATLRPAVDIFETSDGGLGIVVDMPGVHREEIDIQVENDILTITGTGRSTQPGTRLYQEFELGRFFRQFQLSDSVDQEKIHAEIRQGVLTIHLPKAEKAKPRQIAVNVTS